MMFHAMFLCVQVADIDLNYVLKHFVGAEAVGKLYMISSEF